MIRARLVLFGLACAALLQAAPFAGARALQQAAGAGEQNAAAAAPGQSPPSPAAQPVLPLPAPEVVQHVGRSVNWYRRITALQQLPINPDELILRDRLSQASLTALRLAFDFGRAAVTLANLNPAPGNQAATSANAQSAGNSNEDSASGGGIGGELDEAAARLSQRMAALQSQQTALDEQLAHAPSKEREALLARRGEVLAALNLVKEIQSTVAQLERFEESSQLDDSRSSGLARQIADLQRSVPEARRSAVRGGANAGIGAGGNTGAGANAGASGGTGSGGSSGPGGGSGSGAPAEGSTSSGAAAQDAGAAAGAASAAHAAAAAASTFRPESAGVIALISEWLSLHSTRGQIADATKDTDGLLKQIDQVRTAITQDVRGLARQELQISSSDAVQLAQARQQLDAATNRFRQLSTLLIPLGEQDITVESARNLLVELRNSVTARSTTVSRYLALRIGMLLGSIAVVLAISEIWRRATFRYLHDSRRRAQFLALRRVAMGAALVLVIVFGLVSEVGSVATYAGLITAGLAVALQNVILAVVAYFFLIGRYGVRVGDRITLAGVTGRVVDIGLVRIYLMELSGPELRSSGRMVVLSNAVLFQPAALFKQMPGGDYSWHTVTLTLASATDVQTAQARLSEAAESVYEKYRPAIEQQHAALQRFIDFETAMPRPEVYVRLTEKGLECTVRYPVEPARAASIDQKMLAALRETQSKAPELQLVSGPWLNTDI